jgi:hypothetical protein
MRSESSSCFPTRDAMRLRHAWGTQISETPSDYCASMGERSGWLWEWSSI